MDPVTIFGLAANILAFGELTYKIAREAREIHQTADGSPEAVTRLDVLATNLKQCSVSPAGPPEPPELKELRRQCGVTAKKLLEKVQKLEVDGKRSKWGVLKIAVKAHYLAKEIASECADLDSLTIQLNQYYLSTIKDQQSNLSDAIHNLTQQFAQHSLEGNRQLEAISCCIRKMPLDITKAVNDSSCWDSSSGPNEIRSLCEIWDKAQHHCDLLNALWFESIPIRHDQILEANLETFRWIHEPHLPLTELQKQYLQRASSNPFFHWLRSGGGVYWIAGNAGSGKSTLMKYVSDSEKTMSALEYWREDATLVVASFYFWKPGTEKQKSLGGLMQSLLYEIIRQCPDISSLLAPSSTNRDSIPDTRAFRPLLKRPTRSWHSNDVQSALEKIINQNIVKVKICFFIDGLDEFEGRYDLLFPLLKTLADCPSLKLCISSRPQNQLKNFFKHRLALDEGRIINLHEYTENDIRRFTSDYLENYTEFNSEFPDKDSREIFVSLVTKKAEGVFLWADLAVRNLANGLVDGDTRSALLKRLDALPESIDMDLMFQQMLDGVQNKIFKRQLREILDVSVCAKRLGIDPLPLASLPYALFDDDGTILDRCENTPVEELPQLLELAERRVNARCNGLIKVLPGGYYGSLQERCAGIIHRSVVEFLEELDLAQDDETKASNDVSATSLLALGLLRCIEVLWPLPRCGDQVFYFLRRIADVMIHLEEYDFEATDMTCQALYRLYVRDREYATDRDAQLKALLSSYKHLLPRTKLDDVQALLFAYMENDMSKDAYRLTGDDEERWKWAPHAIPAMLLVFGPETVIEKHIGEGSLGLSPANHILSFTIILFIRAREISLCDLTGLEIENDISLKNIVSYVKIYGICETYGQCIRPNLLFGRFFGDSVETDSPFIEYCRKNGKIDCGCGSQSSCVPLPQALAIVMMRLAAEQCKRCRPHCEEHLQYFQDIIKTFAAHESNESFKAILLWYFCEMRNPIGDGWDFMALKTMIAHFLGNGHHLDLPYAAGLEIELCTEIRPAEEIPTCNEQSLEWELEAEVIQLIIHTPTMWTVAMSILLRSVQTQLWDVLQGPEGDSELSIKASELFLLETFSMFLRAGADRNATFFLDDFVIIHRNQLQRETNPTHTDQRPLLRGVNGVMEYLRTVWGIDKDGCIQNSLADVKSERVELTMESSDRTPESPSDGLKNPST